ncbi:hypothetical protein [Archangium sp.]|uniref:hypothetical protein n=1 Tax=Archangium sp. TaxID=1872627 RepID=UPI002D5AECBB|nr:hypothetical protein [Archangium sp.]HYO51189.1 hypothetical protein [Archangium sp.]
MVESRTKTLNSSDLTVDLEALERFAEVSESLENAGVNLEALERFAEVSESLENAEPRS